MLSRNYTAMTMRLFLLMTTLQIYGRTSGTMMKLFQVILKDIVCGEMLILTSLLS